MPRWDMGPGRPRLHPRPELTTPRAIGAQIMGVGTWAEPRSLTTCRVIGPVQLTLPDYFIQFVYL